jgi:hypothetical protein
LRWGIFLIAFLLAFNVCDAQPAATSSTFVISVTPPTSAADVQVRYFLSGNGVERTNSVATPTAGNKIMIHTLVEGQQAKSLKLIAYAPGCEFVTISIDDLSSGVQQAAFECAHLNSVQFHGRANLSALSGKALNVRALYSCDWASQFFGKKIALSPFSIGTAEIAADGSFVLDLPSFSADPIWSSLSKNARLMFQAIDANSGQPVVSLKPVGHSASTVRVAEAYPEVEFAMQAQIFGKKAK